jgi:hypothetical protein
MSLKNPVTRPGIDPGTVRLHEQRMKINQGSQSWIIKWSVEDAFKTLIFTTDSFHKYNNIYKFISKVTGNVLLIFIM